MNGLNFAVTIEELLRRPLLTLHMKQLLALKEKEREGQLSEIDKIYISDAWGKFRGLRPTGEEKKSLHGVVAEEEASHVILLETEIKSCNATIDRLREALHKAVAQRDQWRAKAGELAQELETLKFEDIGRFEKAKRQFAKMYHPNSLVGRSQVDTTICTEVFKEFWSELASIEADA